MYSTRRPIAIRYCMRIVERRLSLPCRAEPVDSEVGGAGRGCCSCVVRLITTPTVEFSCVLHRLVVAYTGHRRYCGTLISILSRPSVWPWLSVPPRSEWDVTREERGVALHLWRSPVSLFSLKASLPSPTNKSHLHVNPAVTLFRAPGALW